MRRIVGELGLRYRPSAQTDLEAHAARIALLSCDVADIPAPILKRAADQWARQSRFMPTAAELVELCKEISAPPASVQIQALQDHCDKLNKYSFIADSGQLYFVNERQKADGSTEHFVDRAA